MTCLLLGAAGLIVVAFLWDPLAGAATVSLLLIAAGVAFGLE